MQSLKNKLKCNQETVVFHALLISVLKSAQVHGSKSVNPY